MNDDIKHALGSAFAEEPPLRVYRDEVLRKGRTRLRQRRLTIAGGFAAVVTVVAFSASLAFGTNSAGRVDPASSGFGGGLTSSCGTSTAPTSLTGRPSGAPISSTSRPSGYASVTGRPSGSSSPSSSLTGQPPRPDVTTGPPKPCEYTSTEHAEALTAVLAEGKVVPSEFTLRDTGHPQHPGPLMFGQEGGKQYEASADLVAADGQEGTLYVMVGGKSSNSSRAECNARTVCESRVVNGEDVQIATVDFGSAGEILTIVDLKRADGTQVYVLTSNVSTKAQNGGEGKSVTAPTIDHQPLTADQLVKIVTLPGLKF